MAHAPDPMLESIVSLLHEVDEKLARLSADSIRGKNLSSDLELDSLDVIKFILMVEEKFGIKIPDKDIDARELLIVDNLATYLRQAGR
jgi:acyl carrier protein